METTVNQLPESRDWEEVQPNVWKAEKVGDAIEGSLMAKKEAIGPNNSKAYYIDTNKGLRLVWGTTVLDDRLAALQIGDYLKIEFLGTQLNKRGQPTKLFKVFRPKQ